MKVPHMLKYIGDATEPIREVITSAMVEKATTTTKRAAMRSSTTLGHIFWNARPKYHRCCMGGHVEDLLLKDAKLEDIQAISDSCILKLSKNTKKKEKNLYSTLGKSRMELYKKNREHKRMILESVENVSLIWTTVEENGVIRTKKYVELSAAEKNQADCDMKATNIIFQGLPADIYSLVNHHRVAKDL
ncbi:hypothetical protein Tco_0333406 [Tanacetum coccineum]